MQMRTDTAHELLLPEMNTEAKSFLDTQHCKRSTSNSQSVKFPGALLPICQVGEISICITLLKCFRYM